ncbi:MAG: family 2 glycosyl transferase [Pseudanabaenales cyanobacterium]|nr:family 2 glycosyl transferase [Pseudanabaenales cyanobacterium]
MHWELCIQYANGTEQVLRAFRDLETAENCVDRLYAKGYPMHIAYLIRLAYAA